MAAIPLKIKPKINATDFFSHIPNLNFQPSLPWVNCETTLHHLKFWDGSMW